MAKPKNVNLGSFVDQVTPEPVIVQENFLQMDVLKAYKESRPDQAELVDQMVDVALTINKQPEFITLGEQIALNTLRKLNIFV
jgi:hypothetical protein